MKRFRLLRGAPYTPPMNTPLKSHRDATEMALERVSRGVWGVRGVWVAVIVYLLALFPGVALSSPAESAALVSALRGPCRSRRGLGILLSPRQPSARGTMRVLVVSETRRTGARLVLRGPAGIRELSTLRRGGPPSWWFATVVHPAPGRYRVALVDRDNRVLACARRRVLPRLHHAKPKGDLWPARRGWTRTMENFYAAWIEKLFDAPAGARPGWTPLHQVLRDPKRNLLFNHLGGDEDGPRPRRAVVVKPDCADLPYFLRAYFAWKLRLPMGYRYCDRGTSRRASRCGELKTNVGQVLASPKRSLGRSFSQFLRRRVSYVHSGSGRTGAKDDESDLFPLKLSRKTLRAGSVYVDPFGHLLIVVKWVPQRGERSGLLYAIDGHPDLSVGRKRFWRGAFMFSSKITGGGFKAFRPLRLRHGEVVPLTNDELKHTKGYRGFYSAEQYRLSVDQFYERMDRVINPRPLPVVAAYRERLSALYELLLERVDSVKAGEAYMKKTAYKPISMPKGARIFETSGAWEDFSTPARDLRLLIAIHEVLSFPSKVGAHPERFKLGSKETPASVQVAMKALGLRLMKEKTIHYTKSDGQDKTLTMADFLGRQKALEIAYNPNDCVEIRWGASGGELATCKRHAPAEQRAKMARYRHWFATRSRPALR
ncbi:MAG: hypothetical protein KAI47_25270 [Deltaproteobacteria bacterium]|nr:hypothetical protein [Deltaproteobacteria bacterium]